MALYYFTFPNEDPAYRNCFHVENARTPEEARNEMVRKFGTHWAFLYEQSDWEISKEEFYERNYDLLEVEWFEGMTQADLFDLKTV